MNIREDMDDAAVFRGPKGHDAGILYLKASESGASDGGIRVLFVVTLTIELPGICNSGGSIIFDQGCSYPISHQICKPYLHPSVVLPSLELGAP